MPWCRYITQQELASLSSYMTARLSLDKVCHFVPMHAEQPGCYGTELLAICSIMKQSEAGYAEAHTCRQVSHSLLKCSVCITAHPLGACCVSIVAGSS